MQTHRILSPDAVVPSVKPVVDGPAARLIPVAVTLSVIVQNGRVRYGLPNATTTPDVAVAEHSPAMSVEPTTAVQLVNVGGGPDGAGAAFKCPNTTEPSGRIVCALVPHDGAIASATIAATTNGFIQAIPRRCAMPGYFTPSQYDTPMITAKVIQCRICIAFTPIRPGCVAGLNCATRTK